MKKHFTLVACIASIAAQAQITVTSSDMPDAGDNIIVSMTADLGTADPAITGGNHTWNFSFLAPDSQRVDSFVNVTSTPFAYQFYFNNLFMYPNHKASYATPVYTPNFVPQFTVEDVYNFYKESTPEYSFVGFGAKINGVPASVKYDSIDVVYTFPMNYGDADSCWSKYGFNVPNFGYYQQERHRVNTVDGWGTLITPYGTFPVLRVKSVIEATDSVYNSSLGFGFTSPRPRETEYKWLGQGSKIPILQVNTTLSFSSEIITSIVYRDSLRTTSITEESRPGIAFTLYPNPAKGAANIHYVLKEAAVVSVEALDIAGRSVQMLVNEQQDAGAYNIPLNIGELTAGIYLVKLSVNETVSYRKWVISAR